MPARDFPMCREAMRLRTRDIVDRVPGTTETRTTRSSEWVCPDCDYFEEVDEMTG